MNDKPIVVVDTQIVLRASVKRHTLVAKVFWDLRSYYTLAISTETINEVLDVLSRPRLREKFGISDEIIQGTLTSLESGLRVDLTEIPPVSRDPKDDIFLATAVASGAQYLVSEDQDLLVLNPYQNIQIINVQDFFYVLKALIPPDENTTVSEKNTD